MISSNQQQAFPVDAGQSPRVAPKSERSILEARLGAKDLEMRAVCCKMLKQGPTDTNLGMQARLDNV